MKKVPRYEYICTNCKKVYDFNLSVNDRNCKVGCKCDNCDGILTRKYNSREFTFDMNKKIPSDLKLFLDKQKDNAKLESIVDDVDF